MWKHLILVISIICRTLVIIDDQESKKGYSQFLESLEGIQNLTKGRGHVLEYRTKSQSPVHLIEFEEKVFDHLLVLSPEATFHGALKMGELVDFVNLGGNVLIAGSSKNSEAIKDFAYEFSIDYATSNVVDYFRNNKDSQSILSSDLVGSKFIVSETNGPILYRGVGQYISGKNPLAQPLLIASGSAFSGEAKKVTESTLIGSKLVLVSSFQAINNARIIFAGSNDMFSNEFFNEKVTFNNKTVSTGNRDFAAEVSKWVFNEKSVLKVQFHKHHRVGENDQHGIYRIKDDMVYTLELVKLENGKWIPYLAKDVQFEAVMLDPYIRQTMKVQGKSLVSEFKLPDTYGVYTFKVDYRRHGLSNILLSETVQVRPFRHDQYPRFITAANPYYFNIFSMMVGFFCVSIVFLCHKEKEAKLKQE